MKNVDKLKEQMTKLLDKATDKEQITELSAMNETVKAIESETKDLQDGYTALFKEYREAVKHASFVPDGNTKIDPREEKKEVSFDDFLDDYMKKKKEKENAKN